MYKRITHIYRLNPTWFPKLPSSAYSLYTSAYRVLCSDTQTLRSFAVPGPTSLASLAVVLGLNRFPERLGGVLGCCNLDKFAA